MSDQVNEFKQFWAGLKPKEKSELAEKADTSVAYLFQVANGHRRAGHKTIGNLVQADERIRHDMFFAPQVTSADGSRSRAI